MRWLPVGAALCCPLADACALQVLVATGRRPFTEGLGLEALGIKKDRAGRVQVDGDFRTALPNVFAIGGCAPCVWAPPLGLW